MRYRRPRRGRGGRTGSHQRAYCRHWRSAYSVLNISLRDRPRRGNPQSIKSKLQEVLDETIANFTTLMSDFPPWLIAIEEWNLGKTEWSSLCSEALAHLKIPASYELDIRCKVDVTTIPDRLRLVSSTSVQCERFFSIYTNYFEKVQVRASSSSSWMKKFLLTASNRDHVLNETFQSTVESKFVTANEFRCRYFGK